MKFDCVEKPLRVLFLSHGKLVGKHPAPFIIIPILLTVILATGIFTFLTTEKDPEVLIAPEGSQSLRNRVILEEDLYSEVVDENMLPRHQLRIGRWVFLIVTPKTDDNILTIPNMEEVSRLHTTVMNVTIQLDDGYYRYEDLCLMWNGECHENDFVNLFDTRIFENASLTYPLAMKSNGEIFLTGAFIGGVTLSNDTDVIEKAEALVLTYNLRSDTEEEEGIGLKWEGEFLYQMKHFISDKLNVYRLASISFTEELDASSAITLDLITIVGLIVVTFCVLSTAMLDWIRTKPILATLGLLTAGLALGSTLGLFAFIGIPYTNTAGAMPFLIIGIGVDDMFIMISAWRRTSVHKSVPDRMSQAMEESALSVTITSVTDALAFGIGCITDFYSIRLFCIYASVAVLFCYFYMITFFAACMAITGYREEQKRHALTLRKVLPKQDAPSKAYSLFCAGGSSDISPRKDNHQYNVDESSDSALMIFFKKYYGPFVTHSFSATVIVLLYLAYLGFSILGCVYLEEGGEVVENIASDDSYLRMYYKEEKKYFRNYGPDMSVIAMSELEYWNSDVQNGLENIMAELEASEYFHISNFSVSWLRHYLEFLDVQQIEVPSREVFLNILWEQFLALPVYKQFVPDIIFDSNNQSIISSRFYVLGKDIDTTKRERDMFLYIRRVVAKSELNLIAYHRAAPWMYEQYIAIRSNTILTLGIGVASMFLISLILIPHPICAITVTLSVVSTLMGVIGYMSHLSIPLDSISMVTLFISMGFSVDYSAHISYAYTASPYQHRRNRSIHALYSLGAPTLQGAISTFLAIFLFALSNSYIYRTFFWMMFLVTIIGIFHGLVFLPVFLMVLVPKFHPSEFKGTEPTSNGTLNSGYKADNDIEYIDVSRPSHNNASFKISSGIAVQQSGSSTMSNLSAARRQDNVSGIANISSNGDVNRPIYSNNIYKIVYNPNHVTFKSLYPYSSKTCNNS
ncbi:patched domain-containing protein 3-like [Amphiura filiformis]|uniref:patched domain-containing protein 3-like n=1 Tax=Amphiura filiformis TaxID=82378 RepID=UPI003B2114FB